jgi:hypothetical protein
LGQKDKSRGPCLIPKEIRLVREGLYAIRLGQKDISRGPCLIPIEIRLRREGFYTLGSVGHKHGARAFYL